MQTLSRIPAHAAGTLLRSRIACSVRSSHIKSIHTTKLPSQPEQPSRVPQLVKPSLWQILLPKVWRRDSVTTTVQSDGTNTVFLVLIFIAIGSQAMQLADVRRDMLELTLMTNSKLTLLKDVIARIGRGEEVDVGKVLGTSHPRPEIEWEEAMQELENGPNRAEDIKSLIDRRAGEVSNDQSTKNPEGQMRTSSTLISESKDATSKKDQVKSPGFF